MMPFTRARISTSREPSAWPTASSETGTFCATARTAVTCIAGGAAPACFAASASFLPQAASARSAPATMQQRENGRHGFGDGVIEIGVQAGGPAALGLFAIGCYYRYGPVRM